jgi:hypothetical protein
VSSTTTVYMSDQFAHKRMTINALSILMGAAVGLLALCLIFWATDQVEKSATKKFCAELSENSNYTTKFTGNTCWVRINEGTDGITSEAWVPSEWMSTIG